MTNPRFLSIQEVLALTRAVKRLSDETELLVVANLRDAVYDDDRSRRAGILERAMAPVKTQRTLDLFRSYGAYVQMFPGERSFVEAVTAPTFFDRRAPRLYVYHTGVEVGGDGARTYVPSFVRRHPKLRMIGARADARALVWNKVATSRLLRMAGILVPDTWHFDPLWGWDTGGRPPDGHRIIVKSSSEAWSRGVSTGSVFTVERDLELRCEAIANEIGQPVVVQTYVPGREIGVTIFAAGGVYYSPPVIEYDLLRARSAGRDFLTWEDNMSDTPLRCIPFADPEITRHLQMQAALAMRALGIDGVGRFDFRLDSAKNCWLFDSAEVPSLSKAHALSQSIYAAGLSDSELAALIVGCALLRDEVVTLPT